MLTSLLCCACSNLLRGASGVRIRGSIHRRTEMSKFHELKMQSITGDAVSFDQYKGKVCLIVNLASR